jgi:6-phosphogluconolactonase
MLALSMEKKRELRVFLRMLASTIGAVGLVAVLASCGTSPGYTYTVSGAVSGMVGSGMVLQNNGGDDLSVSADGSFSFKTPLTDGSTYSIRVKPNFQPTNPSQTCSVSNGSGTVNGAPVSDVVVSCVTGPTSVTVDPFGKYVYAANTDGTISAYNIDSSSGALNPICGGSTGIICPSAGTYPTSITVDPSGLFAYVVDTVGGNILAYTITDGELSPLQTVAAGNYPTSVTVDQSGHVYVANMGDNTVSAYTIQSDGTLVELAHSPFQTGTSPASIITVKLSVGEFAYVTNMSESTIRFYFISSNGDLAPLGELPTGTYPTSVTVDQSGQFVYVANETSNTISAYTIQSDGTLVAGTTVATGTSPTSIVTVKLPVGEFAYVTNSEDGTIWAYTINQTTGALGTGTAVATGLTFPSSITVDPLGRFAYVGNMGGGSIWAYKINSDGTLTLLTTP